MQKVICHAERSEASMPFSLLAKERCRKATERLAVCIITIDNNNINIFFISYLTIENL
jgi:hypothetical protein